MSGRADLELMREIFKDDSVHLALALVTSVVPETDRSAIYVVCRTVMDDREIAATLTWGSVGSDQVAGDLPEPKDLVLIGFSDGGDPNHAFVIARLSSTEELLPALLIQGHYLVKSKAGKKLYLQTDTELNAESGGPLNATAAGPMNLTATGKLHAASQANADFVAQTTADIISGSTATVAAATKINLVKGSVHDGDEPLVLGNVLTSFGADFIDALLNAAAIGQGAVGPVFLDPSVRAALTQLKATYITATSTNFLSQIAFTERAP